MVFRDSLYRIESSSASGEGFTYVIYLNGNHVIYKAHFPGDPITPGVCLLQIAFELMSLSVGEKLEISCAKNVKFLSVLRPGNFPVTVRVFKLVSEEDKVKAQVEITAEEAPVAKMSIICRIAG